MAFFWEGNTGQISTPEQAARKRAVAQALLSQSGSGANNWGEGLARVAQALTGTVLEGRVSDAEAAGQERANALFSELASGANPDAIIAALTSPDAAWATPAQSSIASALLQSGLERQDPMYQMELERAALELEALRNPAAPTPEPFTLKPGEIRFGGDGSQIAAVPAGDDLTSAIQNYNFLIGQGVDPATAQQQAFGGATTNVNVNTGANNDFFSGLSAAEGENFAGMLSAGNQASRNLEQIGQLETLLQNTPQGLEGAVTQFAANLGIDLGGAEGVQAAQALINQMVPDQRPPGSGPMSDADLELYKQSIPRLINQPGGNQLIIGTMRAINEYDRQLAAIVQEGISQAEMTDDPATRAQIRRDMRAKIDGLQNPITAFKAGASAIESLPKPTGSSSVPSPAQAPQSQANPNVISWDQL